MKRPRTSIRFWIMIVGIILSLVLFEEVVDDVFFDPLEGDHEAADFDRAVTGWIQSFRNPSLDQVMLDLTSLGSISLILTLFVLMVSVIATFRDFLGIGYLTTVLAGAGFWPYILKPMFARSRPDTVEQLVAVHSLSFPSGHTFGATAVYIALAFYAGRYARSPQQEVFFTFLGLILISLVGISRIYLGAHYPTDVVGGLSLGAAWGFLISALYESFFPVGRSSRESATHPR